jgi:hypothetical protein
VSYELAVRILVLSGVAIVFFGMGALYRTGLDGRVPYNLGRARAFHEAVRIVLGARVLAASIREQELLVRTAKEINAALQEVGVHDEPEER